MEKKTRNQKRKKKEMIENKRVEVDEKTRFFFLRNFCPSRIEDVNYQVKKNDINETAAAAAAT